MGMASEDTTAGDFEFGFQDSAGPRRSRSAAGAGEGLPLMLTSANSRQGTHV